MKKLFVTIVVLFLALVLVACGGNETNKGVSSTADAKGVYDKTMSTYAGANGVDVKFTYKAGDENKTIVFKYNLENDKIKELEYKVTSNAGELSVYVKDNVAYMNAYGTLSKVTMTDADYATYKEKYTFAAAEAAVSKLFGYSFFSAASVASANDQKVTLTADLQKLEADPLLDEDAFFAMEENIEKLKEKKALDVEFEYANGLMTKFVGTVTEQDDSTKVFTVEFFGTSATVTYPDLTAYTEAK